MSTSSPTPSFLSLLLLSIATNLLQPSNASISEKLWNELGRGIGNEKLNDLAGYTVASSASGSIIAVGSPYHTSESLQRAGQVRIYRYNSRQNGWNQIGQDIIGEKIGDELGMSLHLTSKGDAIAIGSPNCLRNMG